MAWPGSAAFSCQSKHLICPLTERAAPSAPLTLPWGKEGTALPLGAPLGPITLPELPPCTPKLHPSSCEMGAVLSYLLGIQGALDLGAAWLLEDNHKILLVAPVQLFWMPKSSLQCPWLPTY